MARPTTIPRETLLLAAREVFLERGIAGTTAEVAQRACVSEGLLFKRFGSKEALFHAAMTADVEELAWMRILRDAAQDPNDDVRRTLALTARHAIVFFRHMMPLMMMSWSARGPAGEFELFKGVDEPPPLVAIRTLRTYLRSRMRLGQLAERDAEVLARFFLGGIVHFVFFEAMNRAMTTQRSRPPAPSAQRYVTELVDILWGGIAPPPTPAARRPRARSSAKAVQQAPRGLR